MKAVLMILMIFFSFISIMCAILAKVLSIVTIIAFSCWLLGLFAVTGTTVIWLLVGSIVSGLCVVIFPIIVAVLAEWSD